MAYKILKLVTEERIVADVYEFQELAQFCEYFEGSKIAEEVRLMGDPKSLVLLDPMLIYKVTKDKKTYVTVEQYLPYSTNEFLAISVRQILHVSEPKKYVLDLYNKYVLGTKKQEMLNEAIDKMNNGHAAELSKQEILALLQHVTDIDIPH